MKPKISIITPCFNSVKYIEECIKSVVEQDYDNLEYIVIDGGSTDGTLDIIAKYKSRISYFVSEKENEAVLTEREVTDCKKAEYMEDKIGQAFTGKIISVQAFGFFVELPNTVEGLVPLHSLMDDFYDYDETASCLKGEATKKTYQLGQKVDVICVGADKLKGQVSFVCKEE